MTDIEKHKLIDRNNTIIKIILEKVKQSCQNSVDLIGISGSFYNGDIYEKSDLDLVIIINDDKASILNSCFILDDIGFDIYCSKWSNFEKMAEYNDPYVTKLFDLNIIYNRDNQTMQKYLDLQEKAKRNMEDKNNISKKITNHFITVLNEFKMLSNNNLLNGYRGLAIIIREIEYIIYMINGTYVKRGIKRVPEEISK
jgi:hypothetical protein